MGWWASRLFRVAETFTLRIWLLALCSSWLVIEPLTSVSRPVLVVTFTNAAEQFQAHQPHLREHYSAVAVCRIPCPHASLAHDIVRDRPSGRPGG